VVVTSELVTSSSGRRFLAAATVASSSRCEFSSSGYWLVLGPPH
jgi:hypothetical protein